MSAVHVFGWFNKSGGLDLNNDQAESFHVLYRNCAKLAEYLFPERFKCKIFNVYAPAACIVENSEESLKKGAKLKLDALLKSIVIENKNSPDVKPTKRGNLASSCPSLPDYMDACEDWICALAVIYPVVPGLKQLLMHTFVLIYEDRDDGRVCTLGPKQTRGPRIVVSLLGMYPRKWGIATPDISLYTTYTSDMMYALMRSRIVGAFRMTKEDCESLKGKIDKKKHEIRRKSGSRTDVL
jgi:hypothetical protein